jgi:hypothetical protein
MRGRGYSRVQDLIDNKFRREPWYGEVLSYLLQRYSSIEGRMIETFRYVACHPNNRNTFSYEYASILRDAGSVFGSVMDRLVRETSSVSGQLDIRKYREWLRSEVENIHSLAAEINYPLAERVLLPFLTLKDENGRLEWWNAYNELKHSDIDKFQVGNFENALNSVAALAILVTLMGEVPTLFPNVGFFEPEEYLQSLLFFKLP